MALKYQLETLDGLPDAVKALYAERDGAFVLNVEGAVPKKQIDEFRENNIKLMKERDSLKSDLDKFGGVDLGKWNELQETERKLKEKKLIEAGQVDELFEQKFKQFKADHEKQAQALQDQIAALETERRRMLITDALKDAAVKNGVRPTAIEDAVYRGEQVFTLKDGKVVAMNGDEIATDGEGKPLTPESFIKNVLPKKAPHLYETSGGSGARGQHAGGGINNSTVRAGDNAAFLANLEKIATGKVKVVTEQ